ncbi:helix-turn-helix transcriptional regulator [Mumia zhuanghuii]|uniref:Winged helix-turn-helix transcriptional regulator n=2 Tax=Mumia TaxID=1546255 RepID=A0ABW1QLG9_9ACTN|nr:MULTISPECIES: helix-turn-helix domain-containing protein [Mumia]KAA1418341.1 helix-turn-helix transcriptional regulator [Mumia zhuanghuii]
MRRVDLSDAECPIARGAGELGDWWSLLILRDALDGIRRFDEFAADLPISPAMLTRRLRTLVDSGLLERRRYSEHPQRFEYVLTPRGRAAQVVVVALLAWGNDQLPPQERAVVLADRDTGREVEPVLVDAVTGTPLKDIRLAAVPGPAASEAMLDRFTTLNARRARRRRDRGAA